jgi:hypothetical protein
MAAFEWSNAELARVYTAAYQGRTARLCCAQNPGSLTKASTTAQWDAVEISGNGYARVIWTVPAGGYSSDTGDWRSPEQVATITASSGGVGLTWNTAYLVLGTTVSGTTTWDTHVAGIFTETPNVALSPGQPRIYRVSLHTDDINSFSS